MASEPIIIKNYIRLNGPCGIIFYYQWITSKLRSNCFWLKHPTLHWQPKWMTSLEKEFLPILEKNWQYTVEKDSSKGAWESVLKSLLEKQPWWCREDPLRNSKLSLLQMWCVVLKFCVWFLQWNPRSLIQFPVGLETEEAEDSKESGRTSEKILSVALRCPGVRKAAYVQGHGFD